MGPTIITIIIIMTIITIMITIMIIIIMIITRIIRVIIIIIIVIGIIVSLCSIGFVFGVQNASNFRTSFGSCLFDVGGLCFSVAPLFFLFITATIIIIVKKKL